MLKRSFLLIVAAIAALAASAQELYVNAKTGNDANPGSKLYSLRTIAEAARRINTSSEKGMTTIILAEGVYPLTETVLFANNKFTAEHRLIIRAEILPGDTAWNPQLMPTVAAVIPTIATPGDGEESLGFQIEMTPPIGETLDRKIRLHGNPNGAREKKFQKILA